MVGGRKSSLVLLCRPTMHLAHIDLSVKNIIYCNAKNEGPDRSNSYRNTFIRGDGQYFLRKQPQQGKSHQNIKMRSERTVNKREGQQSRSAERKKKLFETTEERSQSNDIANITPLLDIKLLNKLSPKGTN